MVVSLLYRLRWHRLSVQVLFSDHHRRRNPDGSSCARWLNPIDTVWLVHRRVQLLWIGLLSIWAFVVRIVSVRVFLFQKHLDFLLAQSHETDLICPWRRVPHRQPLHHRPPSLSNQLNQTRDYPGALVNLFVRSFLRPLLTRLRCLIRVGSFSRSWPFEIHQERLPPILIGDSVFAYEDLPWAASFSFQGQLKRMADLLVAAVLLLITSPFVLVAALLIWLEDRGPVLYAQKRSGWLGRPFTVYKLRTMTVQPADSPALWTQPGDQRITLVGEWLRRVRLDELPQLLNVLNGEMSLIGPRPERPEIEEELEQRIPHYRKRHWMRPGLSGWAQVCAPYASSVEDSDLKLSFDLYYLRHFSTCLDLVILLRTVKTVLKAGGR